MSGGGCVPGGFLVQVMETLVLRRLSSEVRGGWRACSWGRAAHAQTPDLHFAPRASCLSVWCGWLAPRGPGAAVGGTPSGGPGLAVSVQESVGEAPGRLRPPLELARRSRVCGTRRGSDRRGFPGLHTAAGVALLVSASRAALSGSSVAPARREGLARVTLTQLQGGSGVEGAACRPGSRQAQAFCTAGAPLREAEGTGALATRRFEIVVSL